MSKQWGRAVVQKLRWVSSQFYQENANRFSMSCQKANEDLIQSNWPKLTYDSHLYQGNWQLTACGLWDVFFPKRLKGRPGFPLQIHLCLDLLSLILRSRAILLSDYISSLILCLPKTLQFTSRRRNYLYVFTVTFLINYLHVYYFFVVAICDSCGFHLTFYRLCTGIVIFVIKLRSSWRESKN